MRRNAHAVLIALSVVACNAITGANGLVVEDEPPIGLPDGGSSRNEDASSSSSSSSGGTTTDSGPPEPVEGWIARRPVTLVSDATAEITNAVVLVTLPDGFDAGIAQPDGKDIRFRLAADAQSSLDCFIERWAAGAPKIVWVKVPSVKPGSSEIVLFYGNAAAPAASDFTKTFPRVQKTAGGGAGSLSPAADIDVDWFELAAGDTLTLPAGKPLAIHAARVILSGTSTGSARASRKVRARTRTVSARAEESSSARAARAALDTAAPAGWEAPTPRAPAVRADLPMGRRPATTSRSAPAVAARARRKAAPAAARSPSSDGARRSAAR